jgi:hypothetical protein
LTIENGSLREIQKDYNRILSSWANSQKSLQDMRKRYRMANFKVKKETFFLHITDTILNFVSIAFIFV